jgi:hypothetical protein
MDAIAGFHIHRGILAVGRRAADPPAADLLKGLGERALVLGLFGIANHDNMGGLLRNAAAFGVDAVILDSDCCDPLYRKAIRVSVGRGAGGSDRAPGAPARTPWRFCDRFGVEAIALSPSAATPAGPARSLRARPPCCWAPRDQACPTPCSNAPAPWPYRWRPGWTRSMWRPRRASRCTTWPSAAPLNFAAKTPSFPFASADVGQSGTGARKCRTVDPLPPIATCSC